MRHGFWCVQITTLGLVYPSLLLIYFGEAAYLGTFPSDFARSYFAAIPQPLFWPMFVVAMASALVGSQSLITSAFSVARQSAVMSCFPPVRVSLPRHCACRPFLHRPLAAHAFQLTAALRPSLGPSFSNTRCAAMSAGRAHREACGRPDLPA